MDTLAHQAMTYMAQNFFTENFVLNIEEKERAGVMLTNWLLSKKAKGFFVSSHIVGEFIVLRGIGRYVKNFFFELKIRDGGVIVLDQEDYWIEGKEDEY